MKKAEVRCIIDAWQCLGPNAGLDSTAANKQVWWLVDDPASKVKEGGFSNALPILEQLGIDEISLKQEFKVVKWQSLFKEKDHVKLVVDYASTTTLIATLCLSLENQCNSNGRVIVTLPFR